jgi:hypothetical protein
MESARPFLIAPGDEMRSTLPTLKCHVNIVFRQFPGKAKWRDAEGYLNQ